VFDVRNFVATCFCDCYGIGQAEGFFNFSLNLATPGLNASAKTTFSIYDGSGKLVQRATTTGTGIYTVNLQKLAPGTYYLKVQSNLNITVLNFVKE
jgi:hypothetical protein